MGWYGGSQICPNCKSDKAVESLRDNMIESYYLICPNCGLHLFAGEREWIVDRSYIDKKVIGMNPEDIIPEDMVSTDVAIKFDNEGIFKTGGIIMEKYKEEK